MLGLNSFAQQDTLVPNVKYHFNALNSNQGSIWRFTLDLKNHCSNTTTTIIDLHTQVIPDQFFIYDPNGNLLLQSLPVGAGSFNYSIKGYVEFWNDDDISYYYKYASNEIMPMDHYWFNTNTLIREQFSRIILTSNFEYVTLVAVANPDHGSIFEMFMHEPIHEDDGFPIEIHNYFPVCFEDEVETIETFIESYPCDTIIFDHYILDPFFENLTFDDIHLQAFENAPSHVYLENPEGYVWVKWNGEEYNLFHLETYNDTIIITEGVTDNGCYFIDTINVYLFWKDVYIPNTFTPNFDGNNDYFTYYTPTTILMEEIWIFDRWGGVKWHSNKARWDGTYNGEPLNPAVYVYIIKLQFPNKQWCTYKGDITILK